MRLNMLQCKCEPLVNCMCAVQSGAEELVAKTWYRA